MIVSIERRPGWQRTVTEEDYGLCIVENYSFGPVMLQQCDSPVVSAFNAYLGNTVKPLLYFHWHRQKVDGRQGVDIYIGNLRLSSWQRRKWEWLS